MISIRMRLDIRPRCDRHPGAVMSAVMMQLAPGSQQDAWFPAFVCGEPDCPRHFNPAYGYFNVFKQRIDPDSNRRVPCPHDSLPMYLESYEQQGKVWSWRCAQFACSGNAVEVGASAHIKTASFGR